MCTHTWPIKLILISLLCLPAEFSTYLNLCRSLRFDDKPDYSYLRQLFRNLFHRQGFSYDYVFDWNMLKFVSGSSCSVTVAIFTEHCEHHAFANYFQPRGFKCLFYYVFVLFLLSSMFTSVLFLFVSGGQQDRRGWREGEEGGKRRGGASRRRPKRSWRSSSATWSKPFSSQQSQERGRCRSRKPGHTWGPAVRSECCLWFWRYNCNRLKAFKSSTCLCVQVTVLLRRGEQSEPSERGRWP